MLTITDKREDMKTRQITGTVTLLKNPLFSCKIYIFLKLLHNELESLFRLLGSVRAAHRFPPAPPSSSACTGKPEFRVRLDINRIRIRYPFNILDQNI